MKKKKEDIDDDIPHGLDWSKATRANFAARLTGKVRVILLDGKLAEEFKTAKEVKQALRDYLKFKRKTVA